jgi:hypothetical protein
MLTLMTFINHPCSIFNAIGPPSNSHHNRMVCHAHILWEPYDPKNMILSSFSFRREARVVTHFSLDDEAGFFLSVFKNWSTSTDLVFGSCGVIMRGTTGYW